MTKSIVNVGGVVKKGLGCCLEKDCWGRGGC